MRTFKQMINDQFNTKPFGGEGTRRTFKPPCLSFEVPAYLYGSCGVDIVAFLKNMKEVRFFCSKFNEHRKLDIKNEDNSVSGILVYFPNIHFEEVKA